MFCDQCMVGSDYKITVRVVHTNNEPYAVCILVCQLFGHMNSQVNSNHVFKESFSLKGGIMF